MNCSEVYDHLRVQGTWVNWKRTCDRFLFGDPLAEITGIAVGWMPTLRNLKAAHKQGCNFYITHEPLYLGWGPHFGKYFGGSQRNTKSKPIRYRLEKDDPWIHTRNWLEKSGMVVMRCHDVWDDFPDIGIHGAWAKWLGFLGTPTYSQKFYEVHQFSPRTLKQLCAEILEKLKVIGQESVHYIGDPSLKVKSIALGTGAITNYRTMKKMGADVLLVTDDGTKLWESAQWAEDSGTPFIIVNHATAEEPGIRQLALYLRNTFPGVNVIPIERGCLYRSVTL